MPRTKNFKKHQDHELEPVQERKKKTSRTKQPDSKSYPALYFPKGGHLFNPPKSCVHSCTAEDGGVWTDIGCCRSCCRDICNRYLYYTKLKPAEKKEHLKKQGVQNQH